MRIIGLFLMALVILGCLFAGAGIIADRMNPRPDTGNTVAAFGIAKDTVKSGLKFPDDAEFHSVAGDTEIGQTKDGVFVIRSKVKVKNGLGLGLTYPWYAEVEYLGGDRYRVQLVKLGDDVVLDVREK